MKARRKQAFDCVQVTPDLINEPGQKAIRSLFKEVISAEISPGQVTINTRNSRHNASVGEWFVKDHKGDVSVLSDAKFNLEFEVIND